LEKGWSIHAFAYAFDKRLSNWATRILESKRARIHYEFPYMLMKKLSEKEDTSELLAIVEMPSADLGRITIRPDLLVVALDRPTNPGNIGAIIRSCDALNAHAVIIMGHAADLYDPQTIRATTGSFFSIPAVRIPSLQQLLNWVSEIRSTLRYIQVIGTSAKAADDIETGDYARPTVLLIGNETHGLSENCRSACDAFVKIPMSGTATSMNVACAAAIMLYAVNRQRRTRARLS
jgi:TrmH family RNA methyltransferase